MKGSARVNAREAQEDFSAFEAARTALFPNGWIPLGSVVTTTERFIIAMFAEGFRKRFFNHQVRAVDSDPDDSWWVGLKAFACATSVEIVAGIGARADSGNRVQFETWAQYIYTKLRGVVGDIQEPVPLLPEWTEDPAFCQEWAYARSQRSGDLRTKKRFTVALYWDTNIIPLRYFSDQAACDFLVACEPELMRRLNLESYRKDLRGTRENAIFRLATGPSEA